MKSRFAYILLSSALFSSYSGLACAEIYRWVDAQGNVEYSDQEREGAEKVEVGPTATITMPKMTDIPPRSNDEPEPAPSSYYATLNITFPTNDSAFHSGNGDLTVLFTSDPTLYPNHSYRVSLDGSPVGTTKDNFLELKGVNRGTHSVSLDVIDNSGVVQSAAPVQFTIHRPSIKN
ncbi:DUF4124 domain-containing protein [Hahella aquimaris]|uniref:DUF4124 domain-containing protein n=1 Tax=Hahella sp. HNIBRBA332 TaxID=3015983 RepID=UPI00273C6A4B|nr:DUF4124 domain-containing protein [Hahella sp. HNIBRBA332]WLQ12229.1 DUF4124 domain-containing protein [Hahella sp. HNIBRBA332]